MRTIASLLLWIICSLALFVIGVSVTFKANLLIYGPEEFNGNAGASVAVLMEGILIGLLFGLCGTPLTMYLSKRLPWLRG
jgi:hypothetical protein